LALDSCTATADLWTDPRDSHRIQKPWAGEAWFLEKGCVACVLPYSADEVNAIPVEGEPD
jgi:hypothetical protein